MDVSVTAETMTKTAASGVQARMASAASDQLRVTVDGKFFRVGGRKFHPRGVSYGPFAPNAADGAFASREQTAKDFAQIRELEANLVRVYHVPPKWFLDLAAEHELKVLVDIPWNKHLCFLDAEPRKADALQTVRQAVRSCAGHPAVFAWSVANEIAPDIARWSGARAVAEFIDELVAEAKRVDPDCLCTFTNFPPTEFLRPRTLDFLCFNVYLHEQAAFKNYLARLQMVADSKPLMLGEFGVDSLQEGEPRKCEMLSWQIETAFRGGLAGVVVFSYTDDWWRGGQQIEDWRMGLTTRDRRRKDSFHAVKRMYRLAPFFPPARNPRVSVVVACYNGERTLKGCLESLERLNYPDYEVILVDDGSTDNTARIAGEHPRTRLIKHETNLGLSVARNTGIAAATGEIVAFTDADCRPDEDWLHFLVSDLLDGGFGAIGGHNFLPRDDSSVAAAVLVSPGGPAHVMLTDREAEHVPGCNLAVYKWALAEAGGFDPIFRKAGDDVDICWRLQERGLKIRFSPAGFVWHYRRSTVRAYLRQQEGYGAAEALLVRKHPEYFNLLGGSIWQGRIYSASGQAFGPRQPIIYHGIFGSGWFQTLYQVQPTGLLSLFTSLEYHALVTAPLLVLAAVFHPLFVLALTSLGLSAGVCVAAAWQAALPRKQRRWWSRPLVAWLYFLQPVVRGAARYEGRLTHPSTSLAARETLESEALRAGGEPLRKVSYLTDQSLSRLEFVSAVLKRLEQENWPARTDTGWSEYDLEVAGGRWTSLRLATAVEDYAKDKRLIHCRLRAGWSVQARTMFWILLGIELLIIGFVGSWWRWPWLLLLTLPLFAWRQERQKRNLRAVMAAFLDELAKERRLIKVPPQNDTGSKIRLTGQLK
jgi:GT2 family glycosyltransferase